MVKLKIGRESFDNKISTKVSTLNEVDPEHSECVICFLEFQKGQQIITLECKHYFHKDCILQIYR